MSRYSHLFGFTDYTDFSIFKSFFSGKDKKEDEPKAKNNKKIKEKKVLTRHLTYTNNIYSLNRKQKNLVLKLEKVIDNFLYRKKVKNLIQKLKENYMIVCSANIQNLYLNIIRTKKVKQYKFVYEPILKQNVVFLPRKVYRNKKKLKFIIANIKKEIFLEPIYQTEYENNSFVNVLDLQDIKEKEDKNEEDFQNFLKSYYKNKDDKTNKNNDKCEEKVKQNRINVIKTQDNNKKKKYENNMKANSNILTKSKISKHSRMKSDFDFNSAIKKKISHSLLKTKDNSLFKINPILKERSTQRIKSGRKISFGSVQFSY